MCAHRHDERSGSYKAPSADYQRDGRMYDDDHYDRYNEEDSRQDLSHGFERDQHRQPSRSDYGITQKDFQIRGRAASPAPHGRKPYRDRDREDYTSPGRSYRSSSRSRYGNRRPSRSGERRPRSPDYGGPPSREIMLDGIPLDMEEDDISHELKSQYRIDQLRDVRVIRDRETKRSRGFGFLRFSTIENAQNFLERNHPFIYLPSQQGRYNEIHNMKVRIAFSREREERRRPAEIEDEWTCELCSTLNFAGRKFCFKCRAPPPDPMSYADLQEQQQQQYLGSGDSDAAMLGPPSQFLLIRGLEPNVTEELLFKGVSKLLKPSQASQLVSNNAKKSKVASTTGDANLGAREGSLRRVFLVRDRGTDESWRYGFAEFSNTDESNAALLRFNSYDRFTISSKPVTVTFIHAGVFVPVFDPEQDEKLSFVPLASSTARLKYWNEMAYVNELVTSSPDEEKAEPVKQEKPIADAAAIAATKEGLVPMTDEQETKTKKRKAESKIKDAEKSKKATPAHLQFWSNRHAELHGVKQNDKNSTDSLPTSAASKTAQPEANDPPAQSYADQNKNCCYLCSRQFKTSIEVNKHERLSKLHKDNLQNEELKKKAIVRLKKAGVTVPSNTADITASDYRDRAKERRQAFGPSKKISLPLKKQDTVENDSVSQKDNQESNSSEAPVKSKGAALLGKMGWTSGEGLGARGEGVTEAIATNIYATGVGLGAEGGKLGDAVEEAARNSRSDYKEFLQKTRDKAKERFENM